MQESLSCRTACAVLAFPFRQARNSTKTEKQSTHVFCAVCIIELYKKQKIRKYSCLFPVSEEKRFFAMAFPFPMCRSPRCILWRTIKEPSSDSPMYKSCFCLSLGWVGCGSAGQTKQQHAHLSDGQILENASFSPYFSAFSSAL